MKRIQRKRTKGWKMPPNTVYVGRPTKWGNPFTGEDAVEKYAKWLLKNWNRKFLRKVKELRGKNLACWCPLDKPCHADILLLLANRPIIRGKKILIEGGIIE